MSVHLHVSSCVQDLFIELDIQIDATVESKWLLVIGTGYLIWLLEGTFPEMCNGGNSLE